MEELKKQLNNLLLEVMDLDRRLQISLPKSILQEAIQGRLVEQRNEDGSAEELLQRIKEEQARQIKDGKLKKSAISNSVIFRGDDNKYYEKIDGTITCIDELLPFSIPENWAWCRLKDLIFIQTGASFQKEHVNKDSNGVRILRGGNISPSRYMLKEDDIFVSIEYLNNVRYLKEGDIITPAVTSLDNIGKMAVIDKDLNNITAGGFVFIISPYFKHYIHSLFIAYFMQSPFMIEAMKKITKKSGSAFYNLGKERLKELFFPLPPISEQIRVINKISNIFSIIES